MLGHGESAKTLSANLLLTADDLGEVAYCEAAHIIPHGQNMGDTEI